MASKKSWSDLSTRSKTLIVLASMVELLLTSVALADLRRRDRLAVRGPKWIWGLLCLVQPVGPVLYLLFGRRGAVS
jgi:hypothetical protein